jgi:hypothetical protein
MRHFNTRETSAHVLLYFFFCMFVPYSFIWAYSFIRELRVSFGLTDIPANENLSPWHSIRMDHFGIGTNAVISPCWISAAEISQCFIFLCQNVHRGEIFWCWNIYARCWNKQGVSCDLFLDRTHAPRTSRFRCARTCVLTSNLKWSHYAPALLVN